MLQGLGDIYDALNERLKRAGVLPSLEINQWPELQRFRKQQQEQLIQPGHEAAVADTLQSQQKTAPIQQPLPPETHAASRKLLQLLRESKHSAAVEGAAGEPITVDALSKVLTELGGAPALVTVSLLQKIEEYASPRALRDKFPRRAPSNCNCQKACSTRWRDCCGVPEIGRANSEATNSGGSAACQPNYLSCQSILRINW